jgi:hypothetical protein
MYEIVRSVTVAEFVSLAVPDLSYVRWSSYTEAAFHSNCEPKYLNAKGLQESIPRIDFARLDNMAGRYVK